jgi:hypothetical protein
MSSVIEKLAAKGHLTSAQVERIGRRVAEMVKAAREDPDFQKEAAEIRPMMTNMLSLMGGSAVVGAGLTGGSAAINMIGEKLRERSESIAKAKNYKEMLGANPDLKGADVDAKMVQRHFDTISRFNPEYAADPLVAGQYVRSSLNFAAPNLDQLNNVVRARSSIMDAQRKRGVPGESFRGPVGSMVSTLMGGIKPPGGGD